MHVFVQYNMYVPIYGWILNVLYVRLYSRKKNMIMKFWKGEKQHRTKKTYSFITDFHFPKQWQRRKEKQCKERQECQQVRLKWKRGCERGEETPGQTSDLRRGRERGARELDRKTGLPPVHAGILRGAGEHLEVPLPVLSERRRGFSVAIYNYDDPDWDSPLLSGGSFRTVL